MSKIPVNVGLDYHQHPVQVVVMDEQGKRLLNRPCPNDWQRIVQLVEPLGIVKRAAIEACCGAADLAEELIEKANWPIELGHPTYIAKLKGSADKSDFSDAELIADLARVGYLPRVYLASSYERDLRHLVNHRQSLVDQRRAVKLRVGGVLREHRAMAPKQLSRWSKAWIAWAGSAPQLSDHARWILNDLMEELKHLNEKVMAVEARLSEATAGDTKVQKLMTEAGIGEVTAWVLRAYIGRFDRFNSGKQLSRYCGLSPCNASTGKKQADAGLIDGCNRLLRGTLIQAAHRLARSEPRWIKLYGSLKARGKPASVAVAAVGNRWMRGLWHRMKEQTVDEKQQSDIGKQTASSASSRK